MNEFELLIATLLFVILLIAIYKPIKEALDFGNTISWILSGCVSALSIIGIRQALGDSLQIILIPYAAMGISILAILLWRFLIKPREKPKEHLPNKPETHNNKANYWLRR